jgi:hypothetical protein
LVAALGLLTALLVLVPASPASSGPTRSVTVSKVVDGDGPTGPYTINVLCSNGSDPDEDTDVTLNDGEDSTVAVALTGAVTCDVTETDDGGAASVAFGCTIPGGSAATCPSPSQGTVSWTAPNLGGAEVEVTNVFSAAGGLELVNVSGSITLGTQDALDIPAGDAGFTLEWDTTTGDVTGTSSFGSSLVSAFPAALPTGVCVKSTIFNDPPSGNTSGTIDPDTGEVEFTSTNGVTFDIWVTGPCPDDGTEPTTAPLTTCNIPAFDIPWVSTPPDGVNFGPLPFDPDADYGMTIHADFDIPAIPEPGGCTVPGIAPLFNTELGLPGPGSALLELVRGTPPTPPPTPAAGAAAAAAPATPAAAVTTSPEFTG